MIHLEDLNDTIQVLNHRWRKSSDPISNYWSGHPNDSQICAHHRFTPAWYHHSVQPGGHYLVFAPDSHTCRRSLFSTNLWWEKKRGKDDWGKINLNFQCILLFSSGILNFWTLECPPWILRNFSHFAKIGLKHSKSTKILFFPILIWNQYKFSFQCYMTELRKLWFSCLCGALGFKRSDLGIWSMIAPGIMRSTI